MRDAFNKSLAKEQKECQCDCHKTGAVYCSKCLNVHQKKIELFTCDKCDMPQPHEHSNPLQDTLPIIKNKKMIDVDKLVELARDKEKNKMKTASQLIEDLKIVIGAQQSGLITNDDVVYLLIKEIEEQTQEKLL